MSESVDHNPKKPLRGGHSKQKNSTIRGHTYRVLLTALLVSIAVGIFVVGAGEQLEQYVRDLTVRDILVWLNPAYSEVPEEFLPFWLTRSPGHSPAADSPTPETKPPDAFTDKDNPYCQTAGHAASPVKDPDAARVPIVSPNLPDLSLPEKPGLILPEAPRAVDTRVKPLLQVAKSSTPAEAGQQPDERPLSHSEYSEEQSAGQRPSAKASSAASSKTLTTQERQSVILPKKDTPEWEAAARSEKFQLPGSVLVKIQNYGGTAVRWDLAIIMDDSHAMSRQTKSWNPSRFEAALTFIQKLASTLNPGSKIAVRDFLCGGGKEKQEAGKGCASRLLIDWTPASSKQWKELLEKADSGGSTDPCAAAAFSIKKDFHGGSGRKPRLLIITGAAPTPCASSQVLKALESSETTKGLAVDVLALGLGKKRQKGFAALAQRTSGIFLEIDRPAELDQSFQKYAKVLNAKVFEKVEIKNEKVSLSFNPHQEMSLAPGTYTVILPLVEGIEASRRVIPNVRVSSAETTIIDVTVRKGRPVVRIDKKQ